MVYTAGMCGSAPRQFVALRELDGTHWRTLWDARDSEMAKLSHTNAWFSGGLAAEVSVKGQSWTYPDERRDILLWLRRWPFAVGTTA
jgi:hypothetical protein